MSVWGWDQISPQIKTNSGFLFLGKKGKFVQECSPVSLNDFIVDYAFCSLSEQVHIFTFCFQRIK